MVKLVDAELAGRSYPMTSTFHVFHNTIINRYKDAMGDVFYPISINVAFPNQSYFSTAARKHFIDYIFDRKELFRLRQRKSLIQATIDGWARINETYLPAWTAIEVEELTTIGIKEGRSLPLKFKTLKDIGRSDLHKSLKAYAKQELSVQEAQLVSKLETLAPEATTQLFGQDEMELRFEENQEIPNASIAITESFRGKVLIQLTNRIFLHINNLYSKLPSGKPVFFLGSLVSNPSILDSLQKGGLKYDYQTVFINDEDMSQLAATSFSPDTQTQRLSPKQTPISTSAEGSTAIDNEVRQDSSPQSQPLSTKKETTDSGRSKETPIQDRISKEFVIEKRFKNQAFLLFKGYKRNTGSLRYYRFISHKDYQSIELKAAFIKLYKKVQLLYPEVSTLINSTAGKYYYLEDINAKPLEEVIAKSRLRKGSRGNFKSEDIQLLIDIYQKLNELPITFTNLSADNIYVRQKGWWRSSGTNEVFFLGISADNSSKEEMNEKLNDILQSLLHPAVFEHIRNT